LTGLIDFALAQNFVIAAIFFYAGVDSSLVNWRRFCLRWLVRHGAFQNGSLRSAL